MCHKAVRHDAVPCILQARSTAADGVNAARQAVKSKAGASGSIKNVRSVLMETKLLAMRSIITHV